MVVTRDEEDERLQRRMRRANNREEQVPVSTAPSNQRRTPSRTTHPHPQFVLPPPPSADRLQQTLNHQRELEEANHQQQIAADDQSVGNILELDGSSQLEEEGEIERTDMERRTSTPVAGIRQNQPLRQQPAGNQVYANFQNLAINEEQNRGGRPQGLIQQSSNEILQEFFPNIGRAQEYQQVQFQQNVQNIPVPVGEGNVQQGGGHIRHGHGNFLNIPPPSYSTVLRTDVQNLPPLYRNNYGVNFGQLMQQAHHDDEQQQQQQHANIAQRPAPQLSPIRRAPPPPTQRQNVQPNPIPPPPPTAVANEEEEEEETTIGGVEADLEEVLNDIKRTLARAVQEGYKPRVVPADDSEKATITMVARLTNFIKTLEPLCKEARDLKKELTAEVKESCNTSRAAKQQLEEVLKRLHYEYLTDTAKDYINAWRGDIEEAQMVLEAGRKPTGGSDPKGAATAVAATSGTPPVSTPLIQHTARKLPQLELKEFHGRTGLSWNTWWPTFKTFVHDEASFSEAEKLAYLQQKTKGHAYREIGNITDATGGYKLAIKLLQDRYGNPVDTLADLSLQLTGLKSDVKSQEDLDTFHIDASNIIRQMDALGAAVSSSVHTYLQLEAKISPFWRSKILEYKKKPRLNSFGLPRDWNTEEWLWALGQVLRDQQEVWKTSPPKKGGMKNQGGSQGSPNGDGNQHNKSQGKKRGNYKGKHHQGNNSNEINENDRVEQAKQDIFATFSAAYNESKKNFEEAMNKASKSFSSSGNKKNNNNRRQGQSQGTKKGAQQQCTEGCCSHTSASKPAGGDGSKADTASGSSPSPFTPCPFCGEAHSAENCTRFLTHGGRHQQMLYLRLCRDCLVKGHVAKDCTKKKTCTHCGIPGHHKALCPVKYANPTSIGFTVPMNNEDFLIKAAIMSSRPPPAEHANSCHQKRIQEMVRKGKTSHSILQFGKAKVLYQGQKQPEEWNIFLDSGSNRSFIRQDLALKRGMVPDRFEYYRIQVFGQPPAWMGSHIYKIRLLLQNGNYLDVECSDTATMVDEAMMVNYSPATETKKYLELQDIEWMQPHVLIGIEQYGKLMPIPRELPLPSGFTLYSSLIGNLLAGRGNLRIPKYDGADRIIVHTVADYRECRDAPEEDDLHEIVQRLHEPAQLGLDSMDTIQEEDAKVMHDFSKTITKEGDRYQVSLPWKPEVEHLESNYNLAYNRLRSNVIKLKKTAGHLEKYNDNIAQLASAGIIERVVNPREAAGRVHYLPHQGVWKKDKLRIVFDGSARPRKNAYSLNECLYRGPVLLKRLAGIILRTRHWKYLLMADIEKAFLQIEIKETDRDATRFLWVENPEDPESPVIVFRFRRVTFGLICSPFLLAATVEHHLFQFDNKFTEEILQNIYVDNIVVGVNCEQEFMSRYELIKLIFKDAAMNVREFTSNMVTALDKLPPEDVLEKEKTKILGITWDRDTDKLVLTTPDVEKLEKLTKRKMLSQLATTFDPEGWLGPIFLRSRLLQSEEWFKKLKWDEKVEDKHAEQWYDITNEWKAQMFELDRFIGDLSPRDAELHVFADASGYGIGCAAYIRLPTKTRTTCQLVYAKSLVLPAKLREDKSIPRAELQATAVAVKTAFLVADELQVKLEKVKIWTDSKTVIEWLNKNSPRGRYIDNRVRLIKGFPVSHVKTDENPADVASRGCNAEELRANTLWWKGPEWLSKEEASWPTPEYSYTPGGPERESRPFFTGAVKTSPTAPTPFHLDLPDPEEYLKVNINDPVSGYHKLIRSTAAAMGKGSNLYDIPLTAEQTKEAEVLQILKMQHEFPPSTDAIETLGLKADEKGILRCHGRFAKVDPLHATPIYLAPKSKFTRLLIMDLHLRLKHAGTLTVLAELRHNDFWLPAGKKAIFNTVVKNLKSRCPVCCRKILKPYTLPDEPPLPIERGDSSRLFRFTGLDYAGPFNVFHPYKEEVNGKAVMKRIHQKVYICLFTCLSYRAAHLEVVIDGTAEEFVHAFQAFITERGTPEKLMSDNATTFVLAKKALDDLTIHPIHWQRTTQLAPWRGGCWETLMRIVKTSIRGTFSNRMPSLSEFRTVTKEIQATINRRPLTYISMCETTKPLRPLDFLMPAGGENQGHSPTFNDKEGKEKEKDPDFIPSPTNADKLILKYSRTQALIHKFKELWTDHYLRELRERHRRAKKAEFHPKVGDVVLVQDEDHRAYWRTGRIISLPSSRTADVELEVGGKVTTRAINHLYPLELDMENLDKTPPGTLENPPNSSGDPVSVPVSDATGPEKSDIGNPDCSQDKPKISLKFPRAMFKGFQQAEQGKGSTGPDPSVQGKGSRPAGPDPPAANQAQVDGQSLGPRSKRKTTIPRKLQDYDLEYSFQMVSTFRCNSGQKAQVNIPQPILESGCTHTGNAPNPRTMVKTIRKAPDKGKQPAGSFASLTAPLIKVKKSSAAKKKKMSDNKKARDVCDKDGNKRLLVRSEIVVPKPTSYPANKHQCQEKRKESATETGVPEVFDESVPSSSGETTPKAKEPEGEAMDTVAPIHGEIRESALWSSKKPKTV